jgi:2-hydroxy-6-oxonona-2,4-dienedioate hydrolase
MNDDLGAAGATPPEQLVHTLEARARHVSSPCGEGEMVWRGWGRGEPLVLFHGGSGAWSHWIRNIEAFAADRTVWAPDLPGFGDSASPTASTHDEVSAVLAQGLRSVLGEDRKAAIIGFSMGGVIAAHFAARYPELVSHLILVGSGGLDTPVGEVRLQRLKDLAGEARRQAIVDNLLGLMLHRRPSADDLAVYLQTRNGPRGRLDARDFVLPDKLLQALPAIAAPVDALWGAFDRPHPPADQEVVLRRLRPELKFEVVPQAGHWAMYENADAFNRIARTLLARRQAPPD